MATTLELVQDGDSLLAVLIKLAENKIKVIESERENITVEAPCGDVDISWETCSCHGGRMWFYHRNMEIQIELSSEEYDEELGIMSPETELAYYIDNKMIGIINGFSQYCHVVTIDGELGLSNATVKYFKSMELASLYVFGDKGYQLDTMHNEMTRTYPNDGIKDKIKYIGKEKDGTHFTTTRYRGNREQYTADIYYKFIGKKA